MMRKVSGLLLTLTFLFPLHAQEVYRLGVDELFTRGIENSLKIQSSVLEEEVSEDKAALAKNKRLPDISVSGLYGYVGKSTVLDKDLSYLSHPDVPDWKQNYQVNITEPLYQGGRIKGGISLPSAI